jgi:prepilin-type N-terminal cleavage/methylation domain-containing protein/prepilin-type processing-associated H-X9-DG protein
MRSLPPYAVAAGTRRGERRGGSPRQGNSLIELLIVLAIIAILAALLLPAVQAARESARLAQCKNHLKQLGLAMENHVGVHQRYPANGWGHGWIGHPDRGTGKEQPGGWIYNLLPYLEQMRLREMGQGLPECQQRAELTRLTQVPLSMLKCPTRAAPFLSPAAPYWPPNNADWVPLIAKNDYAVNSGDYFSDDAIWGGPTALADGDAGLYPWTDPSKINGVCFQRSEIRPSMILDGLSQTYLVGEKNVSRGNYATYSDEGYNQSMYHGASLDLTRWVFQTPRQDAENEDYYRFGSAHSAGCHFVFCDGSVRVIGYHIDAEVHRRLGHRHDGLPVGGW